LALLPLPMVPATVVKSSAPTMTGRPSIRPAPATMPSAGTSPTSVPISENDPGSSSVSTLVRASSFPWP